MFTLCIGAICSQVSDLISKIQKAYVETLEELSWMDDPSKEKAREKVEFVAKAGKKKFLNLVADPVLFLSKAMAIKEHIGYPDHILQESNQKLDQEYVHVWKNYQPQCETPRCAHH